ncbi:bifunctional DNA primase/polymerase [Sulfuricaulis sp.]|uniref:bifunctional DNA primase/polymerase n=1 Tax=Sulfuricaulis sp. TaxID=2003553 RepID=UPI0025D63CD9|nr:bifunctional DNA primase/polymerase [Sulfuricaulis sp.]
MNQAAITKPATGSKLEHVLALAERGLYVFPCDGKTPRIDAWPEKATRDPKQIKAWWSCPVTDWGQSHNVGVCTTRWWDGKTDRFMLVIDLDRKNGKDGLAELRKLAEPHGGIPETLTAKTPSGGFHLFYTSGRPTANSASKLAPGVDVRGHHGYVVAPGSTTDQGEYVWKNSAPIAEAPAWLVELCSAPAEKKKPRPSATVAHIDAPRARKRAIEYLTGSALLAVEGSGGDQVAFTVAARLKDFGVSEADALALLIEHWNERCTPPWRDDDLAVKVANAYRYGKETPGAAAPEVQFEPVDRTESDGEDLHPFAKLNREHAFVIIKGRSAILWDTTDERGQPTVEILRKEAFHDKHAAWLMQTGKKSVPVTQEWMRDKSRRSYSGMRFMPGRKAPAGYYNLFRGFAVEPKSTGSPRARAAVEAWKDHLRENVAGGNDEHARWITGWFGHLLQRPYDKPFVALCLYGEKGTGKNALIERVCDLLGAHAMVTADDRYVVGNFNSHLERCLLLGLDETFWAGDRRMEGKLKALITGQKHIIELKNFEPYPAENLTRVVILGNDGHLVPASVDERRYSVFHVGNGRRQDRAFFQEMKDGMAADGGEGYGLLLRYLLDFDLSTVDVNAAPKTAALLDQKHESLKPLESWWYECLSEGQIVGSDFGGDWPQEVETERFRSAFRRYSKDRNIHSWAPDGRAFGWLLKRCAPGAVRVQRRRGDELMRVYTLPELVECRAAWNHFIGDEVEWPT